MDRHPRKRHHGTIALDDGDLSNGTVLDCHGNDVPDEFELDGDEVTEAADLEQFLSNGSPCP